MCLKNLSQSSTTGEKFACHFSSSLLQLPRRGFGKSSGQILNRRVSHQEKLQNGVRKQRVRGGQRWVQIYLCEVIPALMTSVSSHVEQDCCKDSRIRLGLYSVISKAQGKPFPLQSPQQSMTSLCQKLRSIPQLGHSSPVYQGIQKFYCSENRTLLVSIHCLPLQTRSCFLLPTSGETTNCFILSFPFHIHSQILVLKTF